MFLHWMYAPNLYCWFLSSQLYQFTARKYKVIWPCLGYDLRKVFTLHIKTNDVSMVDTEMYYNRIFRAVMQNIRKNYLPAQNICNLVCFMMSDTGASSKYLKIFCSWLDISSESISVYSLIYKVLGGQWREPS